MKNNIKKNMQNIFLKIISSNIILLTVFTIIAILFSELLVYLQLSIFWKDEPSHEMVYYIGFWTPFIDALFIVFFVISVKNIYEKRLEEKKEELEDLNKNLELRVEEEVEQNRKKDQQLLQQSRLAQMGEMISMIAHQWRQPLSAIGATTGNLKMKIVLKKFDSEYFDKELNHIETYVHLLSTIIDDFRNFYKPNKKLVSVTLEKLVLKSLNIIKTSLIDDSIEIVQVCNSREKIELYDSEMMQVILNILKNAQDNFKEKQMINPKITIKIERDSISICDNGGGISDEIMGRIFDPYFSTKDEKNGTGLGLYMSKIIVEEHHNGKLHVSNQDSGVCFIIEIGE